MLTYLKIKPTNLQTYLVTQPFIEFYSLGLLVVIKGNYWFYEKLVYLLTHSVTHQPAQWLTYPSIQVLTLASLFLCRQRLTPESHIYSYSYVCPHSLNKFNFAYLLNVIVLHLLSYLIVYTHSLSISIRYSLWLDAFIQLTHT